MSSGTGGGGPRSTADDVRDAFDAMGSGLREAAAEKTRADVAKQGYVAFRNPLAADAFAKQHPDWTREVVGGETRFRPPAAATDRTNLDLDAAMGSALDGLSEQAKKMAPGPSVDRTNPDLDAAFGVSPPPPPAFPDAGSGGPKAASPPAPAGSSPAGRGNVDWDKVGERIGSAAAAVLDRALGKAGGGGAGAGAPQAGPSSTADLPTIPPLANHPAEPRGRPAGDSREQTEAGRRRPRFTDHVETPTPPRHRPDGFPGPPDPAGFGGPIRGPAAGGRGGANFAGVGAAAGAAARAVAGLAMAAKAASDKAEEWTRAAETSARVLAAVSPEMHQIAATLDADRMGRDMLTAGDTADSTRRLVEQQSRLEDALRPVLADLTNAQNQLAERVKLIETRLLDEFLNPVWEQVKPVVAKVLGIDFERKGEAPQAFGDFLVNRAAELDRAAAAARGKAAADNLAAARNARG